MVRLVLVDRRRLLATPRPIVALAVCITFRVLDDASCLLAEEDGDLIRARRIPFRIPFSILLPGSLPRLGFRIGGIIVSFIRAESLKAVVTCIVGAGLLTVMTKSSMDLALAILRFFVDFSVVL